MAELKCPDCGATVAPSDTHCMDCGVDLAIARMKKQEAIRAQNITATRVGPPSPVVAVANPAAAGMAMGETSDETRLRVFDKQLAEQLKAERGAALLASIIAIIAGIALLVFAFGQLKTAGGFDGVKAITLKGLRSSSEFPPGFIAVLLFGNAVGALLCGVGQARRFLLETRAIAQVERGEKPEVVVMSTFSQIGMIVLAVFCPLFGLIVGIMLKFSKDSDIKALGGQMILCSIAVVVLLIGNIIWGIAESAMPKSAPLPKT